MREHAAGDRLTGDTMATQTLNVSLGDRSYPILIGKGLIDDGACFRPYLSGTRAALVTNPVVAGHYGMRVRRALEQAGVDVIDVVLPDGEVHKTWQTLQLVFDALLAARSDRNTTIVALGGGVIGDIAGLAAAVYQRGVPFIQVPTTLLAQVDSSVGGKTAVNHPLGKNMIGAFYQPRAVIADVDTLATLPARELRAGLAEVIKHGLILDSTFTAWLEHNIGALLAGEPAALVHAVARSCAIKAEIVAADERETGVRALLNFGHTFGHAIEAGMGYGEWLHGEAVAAGMVMAAELSVRAGMLTATELARLRDLLGRAGLPVTGPALPIDRYLELMAVDKKADRSQIRFILLEAIGRAVIRDNPGENLVRGAIAAASADAILIAASQ